MLIQDVITQLEQKYPLSWQEDFDNSGIQCGDARQELTGIVVCFDPSTSVVKEAIKQGANLVISHHPVLIQGIKKIIPGSLSGNTLCAALSSGVVLYAMHTNMDSAPNGGNDLFAQKIGLTRCSVLSPQENRYRKLVFFVHADYAAPLKNALFDMGCGMLGAYDHCSYSMTGEGCFRPSSEANPFVGEKLQETRVNEEKIEMIFPAVIQRKVVETLFKYHPYEEPAFDLVPLLNTDRHVGLGRVGYLPAPMPEDKFLSMLKDKLNINQLRYTCGAKDMISKVALCGGGGASLLKAALSENADAYITGDLKYHDFLDATHRMLVVDMGHFESEHFIREIIIQEIKNMNLPVSCQIAKTEEMKIKYI
ncbi:MAG: Nif3-like dinuclear metal center hexameric protein [Bacteroidales bacterium]|jgi:dinuclear metal center YbgI/SA1388 family protein|nr:Nif3-like dinuclear metal center hexameric protein [Bacteroidales bacterium]